MNHHLKKRHRRRIPWWLHVMIAAVLYAGLRYFLPRLHSEDPQITVLLQILPSLAPIAAIGFLLLAAKALYDNDGPQERSLPKDGPASGSGQDGRQNTPQ